MSKDKYTTKTIALIENLLDDRNRTGLSVKELMGRYVNKVSKQRVLEILEDLTKDKIVIKFPDLTNSHGPITRYKLNLDPDSFVVLSEKYLSSYISKYPREWQNHVIWTFMGKPYVQNSLTTNFVKYIFYKHTAKFRKFVEINMKDVEGGPLHFAADLYYERNGELKIEFHESLGKINENLLHELKQDFEKTMELKVCIPILALVTISPAALLKFIGEWQTYDNETYTSNELVSIEHLVFRLIWDTVNDVSIMRNVPDESKIMFARVGSLDPKDIYVLRILFWELNKDIRYNVEFSTEHEYYGGDGPDEIYELEWNPANARVKVDIMEVERHTS